jgi:hypothetical protein
MEAFIDVPDGVDVAGSRRDHLVPAVRQLPPWRH